MASIRDDLIFQSDAANVITQMGEAGIGRTTTRRSKDQPGACERFVGVQALACIKQPKELNSNESPCEQRRFLHKLQAAERDN
jgi:hypothetical protein